MAGEYTLFFREPFNTGNENHGLNSETVMIDSLKDNAKSSRSQLVSFVPGSYLERTSRPIYALAYLLGFIILYEIGSVLINTDILTESLTSPQVRVVAFVWVRNMLSYLGFTQRWTWVATPLVLVVILMSLQITSRTPWRVYLMDFIPMTVECIILAVPLIVLSLVMSHTAAADTQTGYIDRSTIVAGQTIASAQPLASGPAVPLAGQDTSPAAEQTPDSRAHGVIADMVTGIGAGIYEELVFRLILICLLMMIFQDVLGVSKAASIILSVGIAAVLFSAHHHIFFVDGSVEFGEPFTLIKFLFRTLAGVYFAVIFAFRGFSITAGTHAFYNIIAAVFNAWLAG